MYDLIEINKEERKLTLTDQSKGIVTMLDLHYINLAGTTLTPYPYNGKECYLITLLNPDGVRIIEVVIEDIVMANGVVKDLHKVLRLSSSIKHLFGGHSYYGK